MPLPALPATHRWVDGGGVIRYIGQGVTGPAKDTTMYCWDADTDALITDLYDANGFPCTEIPLQDKTFRAGVPLAVTHPVFSAGPTGPRISGQDWDAMENNAARAAAAAASASTSAQG